MSDRSNKSPARASGVRGLTIIVMGLFLATAAILISPLQSPPLAGPHLTVGKPPAAGPPTATLFQDEKSRRPFQETIAADKFILTLNKIIPEPEQPAIPVEQEADQKKIGYNFGIDDTTGRGSVRTSKAKIGVDYKVSKDSTVGVEASRKIHDAQDAEAWGKSVDDDHEAQVKYKLLF